MLIKFDDGRKYDVRFEYKRVYPDGLVDTTCEISTVEIEHGDNYKYTPIAIGVAEQSKKDKHVKAIARIVALTKALSIFSKEDRRIIWNGYWEHIK